MKKYLTLKLLICSILFWFGSYIHSQPSEPINLTTYPIPFSAQMLKAVDMNNDRKTDLIVMSNAQETGFATYYGNGDETFGLPQIYNKDLNFVNFDVADLNNDGFMDLVLSSYWFNGFKTYFGDENQQFLLRDSYNMGAHATAVTISDINNDGCQDILGITSGSGNPVTLNVYKGDKSGIMYNAGKYSTLLSGYLNSFVVDKNGDKLLDVIISTRDWLAIFYQQTNFKFLLKYWPVNMASVTIGDVNYDNLPDMVLGHTSYDLGGGEDSILVRFGLPDTTFSSEPVKLLIHNLHPGSMHLADLNHDRLPELIINQLNTDGRKTDSLYIFSGLGNDGFELQGIYKLPEAINSFTVADLKNDFFPEIILISDKTLMIMHNSGSILSSGDSQDLNKAKIYPNPVSNWLFLELPPAISVVKIMDIYGKVHYVSKYPDSLKINIQSLASGIYIVQGFQKDRLLIARKIIKL